MANKIFNRVKMSVASIASAGIGNLTLGSALAGFMSFSQAGVANGDTVPYAIEEGVKWEIGVGTYTASGTLMARSVSASYDGTTLGTSPVAFTSACIVMITPRAEDLILSGLYGTLPVANGGTGLTSLTAGYIPYASSSSALSFSSNIYSTGTNIGIGTSSPQVLLDVSTPSASTSYAYVRNTLSTVLYGVDAGGAGYNYVLSNAGGGNGNMYIGTAASAITSFYTSNTERMRIGSNGNVAINETNTSLATLLVKGRASTTGFYTLGAGGANLYIDYVGNGNNYYDAATHYWRNTYSTSLMTLDAYGNLGIGTSSPGAKLDVYGGSGAVTTTISAASGQNAFLSVMGNGNTFLGTSFDIIQDSSNAASIFQRANAPLLFGTNNTERMRIDSSGNVGIGRSNPSAKLDVYGTIQTLSNAAGGGNLLQYTTLNALSRTWKIANDVNVYGDFGIQQSTTQTGSTFATQFYIDASGNVGIGTSSPNGKFQVKAATNQNFQVAGSVSLANSIVIAGVNDANSANIPIEVRYATNLAFYDGGTERARIDSSGNLLVGTTSSATGRVFIRPANATTPAMSLDGSTYQVTVANSSNGTAINTSYMDGAIVYLRESLVTGNGAVIMINNATVVILGQTSAGFFVASSSPSVGTVGIAWSGSDYKIYNAAGSSRTFQISTIRMA